MKSKIFFIFLLTLLLLVSVQICRRAGLWLVKEDKLTHADAIVMLMGSISDCIREVSYLNNKRLASKVIIVKESMKAYKALYPKNVEIKDNTDQVVFNLINLGIPSDSIIVIPGEATSTQMEARIVRTYLQKNFNIDTILLVSSSYHTRRASMIFNYAFKFLNKHIYIISCPSLYTKFEAKSWWKSRSGIQAVFMEYLKTVNFLVFQKRKLKLTSES